ncbi:hypothetical protein [Blastococcus goldschmidtiae]|uniref:Uncharacterized protein n=1 Tax=Blastococcus goldschmidtiae TaxID=3075546 RepID=A0ABU2KAS0_9ACTN|nr:hypothetical protein [Blastococcus sp. DSM 46792]MDT0277280.1 hypothetical protein [Blastococcus sp. DSM 46792]
MPADEPTGQPVFRALLRPRPLSTAERRLLSWLTAQVDADATAQVADATVVGECACGCSSVRLSPSGWVDGNGHSEVRASARAADGAPVAVVLHLLGGRLHELEVFDTAAGEGVAVDLAALTALELGG